LLACLLTQVRRQFYISVRDTTVKGVRARASIRPALLNKLTLGEVLQAIMWLSN